MCWDEDVDAAIKALADQVRNGVDSGRLMIEETRALAELISARAQVLTFLECRNR